MPVKPLLKICGLRTAEQAAAVVALGVDAIGVIGVRQSPRWLDPAERPTLWGAVAAASGPCLGVLVVADPGEADLEELAGGGHDVVQLHGAESVERCRELRQRLGKPIWKALRIRSAADLTTALAYGAAVDALLLDAWVDGALGGTGQAIPLDLLAAFAPPGPWWLAGGITPERVPQVLAQVHPTGLDASSGVELAPGVKDLARVAALRAAISGSAPIPAA